MKLVNLFADFLRETVNLNQTRIDTLEASIGAIQRFVRSSEWRPRVWKFEPQGSWAHDTIIKPVENAMFDADLLVIVEPVNGWTAADYINSLGDVFADSGVYADKTKTWEYCSTISYVGDRKIDVAPCVRGRKVADQLEVCNRQTNQFETTDPVAYTKWIRDKNGYSRNNSLRKVTRLVKYMRDIRGDFSCPSVMLTTMLADQIHFYDVDSDQFKDVPSTLKTVFGRLDDWMRDRPTKPIVQNPSLGRFEDFAEHYTQDEWEGLREVVASLRADIDTAFATKGRFASIEAWQAVFGRSFGKYAAVTKTEAVTESYDEENDVDAGVILAGIVDPGAAHASSIVDKIRQAGRWIWSPSLDRPKHMSQPVWERADTVTDKVYVIARWSERQHSPSSIPVGDFEELPPRGGLTFDVVVAGGKPLPQGFRVMYRVTNTGAFAMAQKNGRGRFEKPQLGNKRWEPLEYRGVHLTEAFIIRDVDNKLVGQSAPFHVLIG